MRSNKFHWAMWLTIRILKDADKPRNNLPEHHKHMWQVVTSDVSFKFQNCSIDFEEKYCLGVTLTKQIQWEKSSSKQFSSFVKRCDEMIANVSFWIDAPIKGGPKKTLLYFIFVILLWKQLRQSFVRNTSSEKLHKSSWKTP